MTDQDALDMIRSSIILLLSEQSLHGYGIMKEVKIRIGKSVNPGLLYPFLRQLEEKGFVKSTKKPIGQKPKKIYELTNIDFALFFVCSSPLLKTFKY